MRKTWLAAPVAVAALCGVGVLEPGIVQATQAAGTRETATAPERVATLEAAPEVRPARVTASRRVALVIGNASYPDDEGGLIQPINDARAIATELTARGFDVITGENLTRLAMRDAIDAFAAKVAPHATALVFFSGYGIQVGRQSYLIPVDAQIWREADVRREGIAVEPILASLDARRVAAKVVVLDASRRNPYERRFRGLSVGLAPINTPVGTLMIFGAAPGTVARDTEGPMSPFVGALIAELRRGDGSAEDVFSRTRREVARASQGERMPVVFSSMTEHLYLPQAKMGQNPRPERFPNGQAGSAPAIPANLGEDVSAACWMKWGARLRMSGRSCADVAETTGARPPPSLRSKARESQDSQLRPEPVRRAVAARVARTPVSSWP
jgi:hypothetical protein